LPDSEVIGAPEGLGGHLLHEGWVQRGRDILGGPEDFFGHEFLLYNLAFVGLDAGIGFGVLTSEVVPEVVAFRDVFTVVRSSVVGDRLCDLSLPAEFEATIVACRECGLTTML
jgi:hypothetical protein